MNNPAERRIHDRYPAEHLCILAKSLQAKTYETEKGDLVSVDFNRHGIAFESQHCFSIGELLLLVVSAEGMPVCEVHGVICHRTKNDEKYRHGLYFEFSLANDEDALQQALATLEKPALAEA